MTRRHQREKVELERQISHYLSNIKSLEVEIKQLSSRRAEENQEWEEQLDMENHEKNELLTELER